MSHLKMPFVRHLCKNQDREEISDGEVAPPQVWADSGEDLLSLNPGSATY